MVSVDARPTNGNNRVEEKWKGHLLHVYGFRWGWKQFLHRWNWGWIPLSGSNPWKVYLILILPSIYYSFIISLYYDPFSKAGIVESFNGHTAPVTSTHWHPVDNDDLDCSSGTQLWIYSNQYKLYALLPFHHFQICVFKIYSFRVRSTNPLSFGVPNLIRLPSIRSNRQMTIARTSAGQYLKLLWDIVLLLLVRY